MSHHCMLWITVALTTLVLLITIFTSFPPARESFPFFFEISTTIMLLSLLAFSVAWILNVWVIAPRRIKVKYLKFGKHLSTLADVWLALGCLLYYVALTILLFSLGMFLAVKVFSISFILVFSFFFLLRFVLSEDES